MCNVTAFLLLVLDDYCSSDGLGRTLACLLCEP